LKKYEHIIWDWNGTLLDDARTCVDVLNWMLEKYEKCNIEFEQYRRTFCFPVIKFYEGLGFDFAKDSYHDLAVDYISRYHEERLHCRLHERAREILEVISSEGIGQSILSASESQSLREIVNYLGIGHFFSNLAGRDDHYADEKTETGKQLVNQLGLNKDKILMVGDTIHDCEVADEIGVEIVLFSNGHQCRDILTQCGVAVIDSLDELPGIIGIDNS
jgi:phosphoglycolate phosphatase